MENVKIISFGNLSDGREAKLFILKNENITVSLTNYGAAIVSIVCPDKNGNMADVVAGFENAAGYEQQDASIGMICGRVAGRIAYGKFTLDSKEYKLAINNNGNHLHGGIEGFNRKLWDWRILDGEFPGVEFTYTSPAGEEGYPGTLKTSVIYTLQGSSLHLEIDAATDAPTIVNLTNHAYFNLSGDLNKTAMNHILQLNADYYLEIDETSKPSGVIAAVKNTPFDFTSPHTLAERIEGKNQQLEFGTGYDHPFCINQPEAFNTAAEVKDPHTGRTMIIQTNQPSVVLYTANWLNGKFIGKQGVAYNKRCSFCLETQVHADAINHSVFPSVVLRPGESYRNETVYTFAAE